jgi:hypothetical protein
LRGNFVLAGVAVLAAGVSLPARAQSWVPTVTENFTYDVFFFGGRFESRWFPDAFNPALAFFVPFWEDNFLVGGGAQVLGKPGWGGFKVGAEVGAAARLSFDGSGPSSGEIWAGPVVRFPGWQAWGWNVNLSWTGGLSAVTHTIGAETGRSISQGYNIPVLFYMGPELDLSPADNPNWEVFWRVQHRSGGYGLIAPIDGSNADALGIRFKF